MADNDPDLDLPEVDDEDEKGFPWIGILVIVAIIAALGFWIMHGKSYQSGQATSIAALESQITSDKQVLEAEKQKVFDLTAKLDTMKRAMQYNKVPDQKKAHEDYNQLVAEQNAQRDKVKKLADQYNEKVAKLQSLQ
jgi:cell division protein FtsL